MVKHTQTIRRRQRTNFFSVFDHFVGLVLKGLIFKSKTAVTTCSSFFVKDFKSSFIDLVYSLSLMRCLCDSSCYTVFVSSSLKEAHELQSSFFDF